jgi:homospermidine synthase
MHKKTNGILGSCIKIKCKRGYNRTNVYTIDGKELNSKKLTNNQLLFIETYKNRKLYNDFRNKILSQEGDDIECTIKNRIPNMIFDVIYKHR